MLKQPIETSVNRNRTPRVRRYCTAQLQKYLKRTNWDDQRSNGKEGMVVYGRTSHSSNETTGFNKRNDKECEVLTLRIEQDK